MTHHELQPRSDTVSDVLTYTRPPVLSVQPGDQVTVRTLDCLGNLERALRHGSAPQLIAPSRGHCLAGPIAVAGARPGQTLAVRIDALETDDWGFTVAGFHDNVLNRRLDTVVAEPGYLFWEIADGVAMNQHGVRVEARPFLGVIGVPPDADGEHSTIPPRATGAGNIDCKELVAGSTLFIPVTVDDAYLFVGDGHAAQGDGEVGGTAIETGMIATLTLDLLDASATGVAGIHAETPAGLVTFGFDADLNAATGDALSAMLDWLQHLTGLPRATALALASPVVDMRITQIANTTWGVHALLPQKIAAQLRRPIAAR